LADPVYVLFFTVQEVKSVDMCKHKSDGQAWTAWPLKGQSCAETSVTADLCIPEEKRTHLHYGRSLMSWMLLLVLSLVKRLAHF